MASLSQILLLMDLATGESSYAGYSNWGEVQDANNAFLEAALGQVTSKTLTASNVTLTDTEERSLYIKLSGTLAANVEVRTNDRKGFWFVENACAGAFTVTFKPTSGTGVVIPAASRLILVCDGTNTYSMSLTAANILSLLTTVDGTGSGLDADTVDGEHAINIKFPAGTSMLFMQTAAPTGWTKQTTHNDKALRIVSGTASSGGSVAFTTAFASKAVAGDVGATALTTANLPAHAHAFAASGNTGTESADHTHATTSYGGTDSQGSHAHAGYYDRGFFQYNASGGSQQPGSLGAGGFGIIGFVNSTASAGAHSHNVTVSGTSGGRSAAHYHSWSYSGNTSNAGSGTAHDHTFTGTAINMAVNYVDAIIANKD